MIDHCDDHHAFDAPTGTEGVGVQSSGGLVSGGHRRLGAVA